MVHVQGQGACSTTRARCSTTRARHAVPQGQGARCMVHVQGQGACSTTRAKGDPSTESPPLATIYFGRSLDPLSTALNLAVLSTCSHLSSPVQLHSFWQTCPPALALAALSTCTHFGRSLRPVHLLNPVWPVARSGPFSTVAGFISRAAMVWARVALAKGSSCTAEVTGALLARHHMSSTRHLQPSWARLLVGARVLPSLGVAGGMPAACSRWGAARYSCHTIVLARRSCAPLPWLQECTALCCCSCSIKARCQVLKDGGLAPAHTP